MFPLPQRVELELEEDSSELEEDSSDEDDSSEDEDDSSEEEEDDSSELEEDVQEGSGAPGVQMPLSQVLGSQRVPKPQSKPWLMGVWRHAPVH